MVFSKGFIYRWGWRIKDFGERMAHARLFGVPVFRPICDSVIGLGCRIKDSVLSSPIGEM